MSTLTIVLLCILGMFSPFLFFFVIVPAFTKLKDSCCASDNIGPPRDHAPHDYSFGDFGGGDD